MNKIIKVTLEALPVIIMVVLIPLIPNDYTLATLYIIITGMSFILKKEKGDVFIYCFGLVIMTISETFFLMTGVETFNRATLFGIMPIWLPLLWAYGFVAIKRGISVLEH